MDDETKLTLHGLQQYYCKLKDSEKNRKLFDLLDVLEFNQVREHASLYCCKQMFVFKMSQILIESCNRRGLTQCFLGDLRVNARALPLGGDLRQVSSALRRSVPATGGAKFPCHCHPQGNGSGGKVTYKLSTRKLALLSFKCDVYFSFNSTHYCLQRVLVDNPLDGSVLLPLLTLSQAVSLSAIQRLPAADPGRHKPFWPRDGH